MKISVITLFPGMFQGPFDYSIVKRAIEDNKLEIEYIDLREFGIGKHKIVDDKPYGGGQGMILKVDVLKSAIEHTLRINKNAKKRKIILLSAKGETFNQKKAFIYSNIDHMILICGHYEGVDERILNYIDNEISIGDYILTGGEIAAITLIDSVTRLIKGVLKDNVTENESFTKKAILEHPQYTRPEVFDGKKVPSVLIEGNHAKIKIWKEENKKVKN